MSRKKTVAVDWSLPQEVDDFELTLKRFKAYLKSNGRRESTIDDYVLRLKRFLKFAQNDLPPTDIARTFREQLIERNLARSTINNYSFALERYYEMHGIKLDLPFLERNNNLPYFFDQDDVAKIFGCCRNLKHLSMLKTLFYGCLRASELCHLDIPDIDFKSQSIRVREGKGGKDGIVFIKTECITTLRAYMNVRPPATINGLEPLFSTDYGGRWDRKSVHRMFVRYKAKAGISKPGGVHAFARHTPATLMIANGCDIRIVQKILRHNDIATTVRYCHVTDETKRDAYEKYLTV